MSTLTANISFMFQECAFLDRIDAAKAAGIDRVECHFPYDTPIPVLKERLARASVTLTGLNTAPGDVAKGEWGLAGLPGRTTDFRRDFDQAVDYASALGVPMIHVMAGVVAPETKAAARNAYVENLRAISPIAAKAGITILLEPLNTRDKPNYLVSLCEEITGVIDEVGQPNVKLLFDVYHVQIMQGDIIKRLERLRDYIGHIQIAAVPSRAEPDEGEVSYKAIFAAIEAIGYKGLIGLEYKPRGVTEQGLAWIPKILGNRGK